MKNYLLVSIVMILVSSNALAYENKQKCYARGKVGVVVEDTSGKFTRSSEFEQNGKIIKRVRNVTKVCKLPDGKLVADWKYNASGNNQYR